MSNSYTWLCSADPILIRGVLSAPGSPIIDLFLNFKVFSRLLGNEQFTDVLLATEGQTIRCHKVVLSACSSYFENLFMTFDEKNQIIILKDTSYDDILAIVDFMYRGEINVGQVNCFCLFLLFYN